MESSHQPARFCSSSPLKILEIPLKQTLGSFFGSSPCSSAWMRREALLPTQQKHPGGISLCQREAAPLINFSKAAELPQASPWHSGGRFAVTGRGLSWERPLVWPAGHRDLSTGWPQSFAVCRELSGQDLGQEQSSPHFTKQVLVLSINWRKRQSCSPWISSPSLVSPVIPGKLWFLFLNADPRLTPEPRLALSCVHAKDHKSPLESWN